MGGSIWELGYLDQIASGIFHFEIDKLPQITSIEFTDELGPNSCYFQLNTIMRRYVGGICYMQCNII